MKKSLAHLPLNKKQELKRLKSIILKTVPTTEFIILFGSYARGNWVDDKYMENGIFYEYKSDFDILAITKDKESAGKEGPWMKIEHEYYGIFPDRTPIDIISHYIQKVNCRLKERQYFFTDIKKEGILLYNSGNFTLERACKIDPQRRLEITLDDFDQCFINAINLFKGFAYTYLLIKRFSMM